MRVLLDSNIWRYFVDANAVGRLVSAVNRSRSTLCVAPACLYEATHAGSPQLRAALLAALTLPAWTRLMPEAFSEAEAIKREVARCRPEWMRTEPTREMWRRLRHDWIRLRGGAWDRARDKSEMISGIQRPSIELARIEIGEAKKDSKSMSAKWRSVPLPTILASEVTGDDGAAVEPVEAWRVSELAAFRTAMSQPDHPYIDWLDGEVDLSLMNVQLSSLRQFWLHEIRTANMPRAWLRWAFGFLQGWHKISDGTPVDSQLGTYLLDVDLFISADRVLIEIAERCRREAPFGIAVSMRVPGGPSCVDEVISAIKKSALAMPAVRND